MYGYSNGFTLIELLVVIVIVAILVLATFFFGVRSLEKAKVAQVLAQITETKRAYALYRTDTRQIPMTYGPLDTNPLIADTGEAGWNGPYTDIRALPMAHPWKGHFGWYGAGSSPDDRDGNGAVDFIIVLNDDAPGMATIDNSALIPLEAMKLIDKELDDGDLESGIVQGNGADFEGMLSTEPGELAIWLF